MSVAQKVDTAGIRAAYASAVEQANKIAAQYEGKSEIPKEAADQMAAWLGKSEEYKAQLTLLSRLNAENEGLSAATTNPVDWRVAAPGEGDLEVDAKSWHSFDIQTASGTKAYRFNVPLATGKDSKSARQYASAFEAYVRYGAAEVKGRFPNDFKALSAGTDTAGGFLIPQDFQSDLLKKMATTAIVRANARVIQTSRDMVTFARVNYTTDNKYTSPARMTWTGETPATSTTHRVTDQTFGQINIPVNVAMASQLISNSLIEDGAFDVLGYAGDSFVEAFNLGENDAFWNGSGVSQPRGIITEVSAGTISYTVSGTSNSISTSGDAWTGKRFVDLYYAHPAQYRNGAIWAMNSTTMAAVENLVDAQKRPLIRELATASMAMGEPAAIKGKPVAIDEFVPDVSGDGFPVIFGQMAGYTIVDRVGFSVQRLDQLYAEYDQTLLIARKRVGGGVTEAYRLRALKAGTS